MRAVEALIARQHRWQDIVDGYPAALVYHLAKAAGDNRRRELLEQAYAVNLAVLDALDQAFGKNQGILQQWRRQVEGAQTAAPAPPEPEISLSLQRWLGSLPLEKRRRTDG